MSGQCTICLCDYKEPVSIPCGHVYCMQCLSDYISTSSRDGFTAKCPTCRTKFTIVVPELHSLSKLFHRYVTPSIRRVFVEPNPSETYEELKHRLEVAEARNATLERDNRDLMDSCERYMAESAAHARGERSATIELQRVKRQLETERKMAKEEAARMRELLEESRKEANLARTLSSTPSPATIGIKRVRFENGSSDGTEDDSPVRDRLTRSLPSRSIKRIRRERNNILDAHPAGESSPSQPAPPVSLPAIIDSRQPKMAQVPLTVPSPASAQVRKGRTKFLRIPIGTTPRLSQNTSSNRRDSHGAWAFLESDSD
ncbi:uncharacterized protein EV420DRAFT_1505783 [Desarmillaria tabescens]|uniref:RING-type domain-containing protein n=1 Tax=Armillaria tabescens TaxID=1929756 RepID=A0AA39NJM5_ARMTA|nr:uncharacterized protein EV420DRAFT_1505783 [Desarmillaria tabescens]KAK0466854.1 hypothetical protein EV420DRAFT_1505783 [Desarmillaria tabescens]